MPISLRPVDPASDFPRLAEIANTFNPEPITAGIMHRAEERQPPGLIRRWIAAVDGDGTIAGTARAAHHNWVLAGQFWISVAVAPEWRRQGIGTQLYDDVLQFALNEGAVQLAAEVRDSNAEWREFAEHRGFSEDRHIFESSLDLDAFDESRFPGAIASAEATGIRFFSLADVGDTEAARRKLHAINRDTALDIPGSDGIFPPFDEFNTIICSASWFRPDAQLVAAEGDRWVGLAALHFFKETRCMYNEMTGVDRAYRGRQIALALKLLSIQVARRYAASYMRTHNDSQNAPMLAINRKLGYKARPGVYKMLAGTAGA